MMLFLPQQIHSIYSTANVPLKYYVLKFDINQLSPSANISGHTLSGIHFNSLFRCAKGNEHAPLYFSADTLDGLPIETLFAKCCHEMKEQDTIHSITEYIEFIRLSKAEDLLLFTNLDLNYISQETGFSDCSHFIKAFRSKHGMTPKQFRTEHSGK